MSLNRNHLNTVKGPGDMDTEEKENPVQKIEKRAASKPRKKPAAKKSTSNRRESSRTSKKSQEVQNSIPAVPEIAKKRYLVKFFYEWCKSCGICAALCPKEIILIDDHNHPFIEEMDACIGCRNCEIHCPDFAITVKNRHPERRRTNGRP